MSVRTKIQVKKAELRMESKLAKEQGNVIGQFSCDRAIRALDDLLNDLYYEDE